MNIILASKSPYKRRSVESLGIKVEIVDSFLDEEAIKKQFPGRAFECSRSLSLAKAKLVSKERAESLIIAGDQLASCEDRYLGKPHTSEKALENLLWMRGRTVELHTSLALIGNSEETILTEVAKLRLRKDISEQELIRYIEFSQPLDCSASFKIELGGFALFEAIECEDFSSIEGIPLLQLSKELIRRGVSIWNKPKL